MHRIKDFVDRLVYDNPDFGSENDNVDNYNQWKKTYPTTQEIVDIIKSSSIDDIIAFENEYDEALLYYIFLENDDYIKVFEILYNSLDNNIVQYLFNPTNGLRHPAFFKNRKDAFTIIDKLYDRDFGLMGRIVFPEMEDFEYHSGGVFKGRGYDMPIETFQLYVNEFKIMSSEWFCVIDNQEIFPIGIKFCDE